MKGQVDCEALHIRARQNSGRRLESLVALNFGASAFRLNNGGSESEKSPCCMRNELASPHASSVSSLKCRKEAAQRAALCT
jgi:hypothetical protein